MYILIMKNYDTKTTNVEKFSPKQTWFPSLALATERGEQILTQGVYKAFNTMELEHFIETMTNKFGIGV